MPELETGGHRTFWRDLGEGPEPALMLHCSLAHSGAWKGVAERLGDRLTMRAFDLPGHGRSDDWDGTGVYQDLVLDIALQLIGETPVHLVGHSFGGTAALRLAAEHPEKVRSLTLIDTVFFTIVRRDAPETMEAYDRQHGPYAEAVAQGDMAQAARAFHAIWGDGRDWDALDPKQQDKLARQMPLIQAVQITNEGDPNGLLARLEGMEMPVLLVEGAESPRHVGLINDGLARRIPHTRRLIVPGAAHMVPITHPEAVADGIRAFLDAP